MYDPFYSRQLCCNSSTFLQCIFEAIIGHEDGKGWRTTNSRLSRRMTNCTRSGIQTFVGHIGCFSCTLVNFVRVSVRGHPSSLPELARKVKAEYCELLPVQPTNRTSSRVYIYCRALYVKQLRQEYFIFDLKLEKFLQGKTRLDTLKAN